MIYLFLKDGKVEPFADKKLPAEKYGLKNPLAEITEKQYEESRGVFRIVKGKLEIGPTSEEKQEEEAAKKRQCRDSLLNSSDVYMLPDFPISAESLDAVKKYRQQLRDLPQQKKWPAVDFPQLPEIKK